MHDDGDTSRTLRGLSVAYLYFMAFPCQGFTGAHYIVFVSKLPINRNYI